jgi:hypothetical protein
LIVVPVGRRLHVAHSVEEWPLGIDLGLDDAGRAWCVLACKQPGCGETLLEVAQRQTIDSEWPTDLDSLANLIRNHAPECAAFHP